MIMWLKERRRRAVQAAALYEIANVQARDPAFYRHYRVADTIDGRFDLVVLHVVLLIERLAKEGKEGAALGQEVFDTTFRSFDVGLREIGVGDLSVGKKIRKMADAFYGRAKAYREALAADAEAGALVSAIARNVYREKALSPDDPRALAAYVRRTVEALAALPGHDILAGSFRFPPPESGHSD